MHPTRNDIAAFVKQVRGLSPQASAAATVTGPAIDRTGYDSCSLAGITGATTGTPTTVSVGFKLQDSPDGSTGWADFGTAPAAITAADSVVEGGYNLAGAKKFIRVACVIAFTGGSSPTVLAAAAVTLGGAERNPAT